MEAAGAGAEAPVRGPVRGWMGAAFFFSLILAGASQAAPVACREGAWQWRGVAVTGAEGPLAAAALDHGARHLAVADSRGALVARRSAQGVGFGDWRRVVRVSAVRDLHFDAMGALWVASEAGLWRLDPAGRLEDRSPGLGQAARRIAGFASSGQLRVAVGEGGAFFAAGSSAWRRLTDGLPVGSFRAAVLRVSHAPPGWALWLLGEQDLWHLEVAPGDAGPVAGPARRVRIPGRPLDAQPVDLALDLAGSELVVVYPRALARTLPGRVGTPHWEVAFPAWPGEARARAVAESPGGVLWLATDRGLLRARGLPGPWTKAASPVGSAAVAEVVFATGGTPGTPRTEACEGRGEQVFVVGSGGLYAGRPLPGLAGGVKAPETDPADGRLAAAAEPVLARVHAQALRHAGLRPEYFRSLRAGLGRRGLWPALALRAGGGFDRDLRRGLDQSFTYGELHDLWDSSDDRSRDYDASITLAWDLGDIAYASEAVDLSREARQVIALRDNVLDELTQLYFDRRRALLALASHADKRSPEAVALRLRAEELAAGLDAWTGGWFSRALVGEAGEAGETADVGLASKVDAP